MADAFIVDAIRTPTGKRGGGLAEVHPADLGAHVLKQLVERSGVNSSEFDDVIFGCVDQIGAQSINVGRTSWLSAGLSEDVPGVTIDRQCGSSQQAVHFAAQAIMAGVHDLVAAGGVEIMSMVPISSSALVGEELGYGNPLESNGWLNRYGDQEISQFRGAELIAEKWEISRDEMEKFSLESHRRAGQAWDEGRFDMEVAPYNGVMRDQGIRHDTTPEKMASLKTLIDGGRITAAVASQISDGAAALLIASEEAVDRYDLTPRARVRAMTVVGSDPVLMLSGPVPATQKILARTGLTIDDIDLFEVAPVPLMWARETGASLQKTNVNGGAIALGHPLGASGAKLMTTLLHELERSGGRFGLQTMCEGGGMANATLIERV